MRKITTFDSRLPHIHIEFGITDLEGSRISVSGILDTGAPRTEFSDEFLLNAGLLKSKPQDIALKAGLQTQKYGEIILPSVEICGHKIENYGVFVSYFDESWGIDALIGLDFFRLYRITVDYQLEILVTEPFS